MQNTNPTYLPIFSVLLTHVVCVYHLLFPLCSVLSYCRSWTDSFLSECSPQIFATPQVKRLPLASNQAHCVMSTERHWAVQNNNVTLNWSGKKQKDILSRMWQRMHYLRSTKDLLNSDTRSQTCPAYFVLSPMLLSGIIADLQSPFHKACIYRLKWHMGLQGHCFPPQSS